MRTKHSLKNIYIGVVSQIVLVLLGFISRKIFIDSLGIDYLGINGLLTNVLSVMALVESGIGISIVYNLYKPLADGDKKKVIALVQLYKKAYSFLALIIFAISICLYPFLRFLMKDGGDIGNLAFIYFLFVGKNMISYLNAHKLSLISADQRGYVITKINLVFQIVTMIARILILVTTKSYILYLVIELAIYLVQILYSGRIVDKRYSYIKTNEKYSIDSGTKDNLIKNIKAMFLHNIGGFMVFGTDNILISSFISIATVGLYSNYTMITQQVSALIAPILGGIDASVGNLLATESIDKNYSIFKVTFLVNFWIYSICVIFLNNLLDPFISWWLGGEYLMSNLSLIFILVNFYLTGMRTAISTFKNKAGLFVQDKYAPIIEGLINLISSLILVNYFGLAGIFMGTALSTLLTVFWTQPVIVYKHVFNLPVRYYFIKYCFYSILTVIGCLVTTMAVDTLVSGNSFLDLIIKGIICLLLPNIIFVILLYKNNEFKYIWYLLSKSFTKNIRTKNFSAN